MINGRVIGLGLTVALLSFSVHAANCDRNPSHPSCTEPDPAAAPAPAVSIDSVIVNRALEQVELRGTNLDTTATPIAFGGIAILPSSTTGDLATLPFGPELNAAVPSAGNYTLNYAGLTMNIYVDGPITNSNSDLCPCGDFSANLDDEFLFEPAPEGECIQLGTQITSGYLAAIYPAVFSSTPLYLIGASYDARDSVSSVCNMVKIDGSGSITTLLSEPIDADQQVACVAQVLSNPRICGS
jgi:hypothetical protein